MQDHQNRRKIRYAVVIIHGMGEQRPMATLRNFVRGISDWIKKFDGKSDTRPRYWSRPDGISDIFETRMITMEQYASNIKTDFYEFYWAHHMRNNSFSHLVPWMGKLLKDPIINVPPRLRRLRRFVWILIIAFLILVVGLCAIFYYQDVLSRQWPIIASIVVLLPILGRILMSLIKGPISQLVLNSAGDAARYFTPMPFNIEERSNIRREGIAFLKKLHERKVKPYEKIIVVGHSLGSVIAYDMLRLLWHELHESFEPQATVNHDIFDKMDDVCNNKITMTPDDFQILQHKCWEQYRANGNPWRITDFITCGAAITHADFYLLDNPPFDYRRDHKEFPACPPVMEGGDTSIRFEKSTYTMNDADGKPVTRTVHLLNHASLFAITRWTNIYFSSDYVGSDAKRKFGCGVKDIQVQRKGLFFLPSGHTAYWDAKPDNEALAHIAKAIGFMQLKREPKMQQGNLNAKNAETE